MSCFTGDIRKTVWLKLGAFFLFPLPFPLFAQNIYSVTSSAGDESGGSLATAVTGLDNSEANGAITFTLPSPDNILLFQPLAPVSQGVTLQGSIAQIIGQNDAQAQFLFQQAVTQQVQNLSLENNGGLGSGLDLSVTAASWTMAPNGSLYLLSGVAPDTATSSGVGVTGQSGGNIQVTTGDWFTGNNSLVQMTAGNGGAVSDNNGNGDQGGLGGSVTWTFDTLTFTGNEIVLNAGNGGGITDTNGIGDQGGNGGSVLVQGNNFFAGEDVNFTAGNGGSVTDLGSGTPQGGDGGSAVLSLNDSLSVSIGNLTLKAGDGGAGVTGGAGGGATLTAGSVTLLTDISVKGGNGGAGLSLSGAGGNAYVSIGAFNQSGGSVQVTGGTGGYTSLSSGTGGEAQLLAGTVTLSGTAYLEALGGTGGSGNPTIPGGPANGGNGGTAGVSLVSLSLTGSNDHFQVSGGNGGSGSLGGNGGNGGNLAVTLGSLTLNTGSSLTLTSGIGGAGGDGSGVNGGAGGAGGSVSFNAGMMNLASGTTFSLSGASGGAGGTGSGGGANGANGSGGTGNANIGSLTMGGDSSFSVSGASADASVSALNGSGFVSVGNLQVQNGTFYGSINSVTLTVPALGYFTLEGSATVSGVVNVDGGVFVLGESSPSAAVINGSVTIDNGSAVGTLSGNGRVNGTVTNSGWVLPYVSMTFTNYIQTTAGALNINVLPGDNNSTFINITGDAHLDGFLTTESVVGMNYGFRDRYQILSGGPISGTFSQVATAVSGMTATALYGSDAVTLVLLKSGVDYTAYANTPNQLAVAQALNGSLLTCSDALIAKDSELYDLPSGQTSVLDQLSGVIYTALPGVMLDNLQFEDDLLFSRMDQDSGGNVNSVKTSLAGGLISSEVSGPAAQVKDLSPAQAPGFWLESSDSFGSVAATSNVLGFNKSNMGFLAGYDSTLAPGLKAGIMGGYLHTNVTSSDSTEQAGVDGYQFGLYGKRAFGNFELSLLGGYVIDHFNVSRTITLGTDVNPVAGAFDGNQINGALQLDYRLVDVDTTIKPVIGLQYARLAENTFTETGSDSLNLALPAQSYDSLKPYLGLGEDWFFAIGKGTQLVPEARVTVSRELINTSATQIQETFQGATANPFTVSGTTPDGTVFGMGLGAELTFSHALVLFANYNGHFSGSQSFNTFMGGANLAF